MIGPEVGTQIPAKHGPICKLLYLKAELRRALLLPGHVFMEPGVGLPTQALSQGFNLEREKRTDIAHQRKCMPFLSRYNPPWAHLQICFQGRYLPMAKRTEGSVGGSEDIWPQRVIYREKLEEYKKREGKTNQDVAQELGLSLPGFQNAVYRPHKRLGLDSLQRSAALFGCSVTLFIDDPGAYTLGQELSGMSGHGRFIASLIFQDVTSPDLTDDELRFLYSDFQRGLERLRSFRARTPGQGEPNHSVSGRPQDGDMAQSVPVRVAKKKR